MQDTIQDDVEKVGRIAVVPTLLEVICNTTGMGFAAIARVTEDRWVACGVRDQIQFGLLPGGELKVETTICNEVRQFEDAVIIDHVDEDTVYSCHPTPKMYGFQSYISVPITLKNGSFFGTLCAIDPRPAQLKNSQTIGMFRLFADLISFHLSALESMAVAETRLLEERKTAELRERFIAVLGHDLRNPAGAISNGAQLLLRMPLDENATRLANVIKNSAFRMNGLIENMLDFARGHLGGGIKLNRKPNEPVEKMLNQAITELQTVWPGRTINTTFNLSEPVNCDGSRIAQLFSNLLGNAINYGHADMPITVDALSGNGYFRLSVTNFCNPIPADVLEEIFQPFSRGELKPGKQGLGLGLYIASEIARSHGGIMEVISTQQETRFTFSMPVK